MGIFMSDQMSEQVLSAEARKQMEALWNQYPALQSMNVKVDLSQSDRARACIDPVLPHHRGGMGTEAVNGAILSSLCDLMVGLVGILNSRKHRTGTVQLNIHFLKPLKGTQVFAEAWATKVGRALVFSHVEIKNAAGDLCVSCEGIASVDTSKPPVENYMVI